MEPYADTPFGSNVLRYRNSTLASQYPTLTYDRVTGFVPTAAYYVAIAGARDQIEPETYYADLHVDWYDDADVLISTDTILEERITGHDFFTVLGGHDNPVFAPENVSYAKVRIEFTNYGDAVPVNHDVYFDGFYFAPYTYFKGAFLEGAASIELTRHYDDRSPTSKLQPGYWYIRVPKTFDGEFNSVPTIYGDVADYGTDQRESQVGIATARPELVGGGDGRRARLTLYSGFQDSSKGSSINLGADRIDTPISSLPNGRLQRAERTSDMSFTNSWVTVATTPAFAFPDGDYSRSICVTGQATLVCTAAPQLLLMRVQYIIGGGAWTTAQEGTTTNPTTSSEMMVHMDGEHTVNAGDLVQWRLQVKRGGSSGTGWVYAGPSDPAWVKAVDEGAA